MRGSAEEACIHGVLTRRASMGEETAEGGDGVAELVGVEECALDYEGGRREENGGVVSHEVVLDLHIPWQAKGGKRCHLPACSRVAGLGFGVLGVWEVTRDAE